MPKKLKLLVILIFLTVIINPPGVKADVTEVISTNDASTKVIEHNYITLDGHLEWLDYNFDDSSWQAAISVWDSWWVGLNIHPTGQTNLPYGGWKFLSTAIPGNPLAVQYTEGTIREPFVRDFFRKRFQIPVGNRITKAVLYLSSDNLSKAWINGVRVVGTDNNLDNQRDCGTVWGGSLEGGILALDVTNRVKSGDNILAVHLMNWRLCSEANPMGVQFYLYIEHQVPPTPTLTPTLTPTITPTPTKIPCDGFCNNSNTDDTFCATNFCFNTAPGVNRCRNKLCVGETSCVCPIPTMTPMPTPTIPIPDPWLQVRGGDVHAMDVLSPLTAPFNFPMPKGKSFMESSDPADPSKLSIGIFSTYSDVQPVLNEYNLSSRNPPPLGLYANRHRYDKSDTEPNKFDAGYWETNINNLNKKNACGSGGSKSLENGMVCGEALTPNSIYIITNGVNIKGNLLKENLGTQIFLVKNTIQIMADIPSVKGSYPLIVATGDIIVHDGAKELNGVFITGDSNPLNPNGFFKIVGGGTADSQLVVKGTVVGYKNQGGGSININRTLGADNANNPAVVFQYDPRYLIGFSNNIGATRYVWEEVAP